MKFRLAIATLLLGVCAGAQQVPQDVLGQHNLTPGSGAALYSPTGNLGCTYCHAPHSGIGGITPLWNQTLSKAVYTPYASSTEKNTGNTKPTLGVTSSLCLSCHDGTVAVGQSAAYGSLMMSGGMKLTDVLGMDLTSSHPFSIVTPMKDSPDLVVTLAGSGATSDPLHKVKLVNGSVECTSCHDPHIQATDPIAQNFLVRDSSSGQMCLACHDPNRTITGQTNPLSGWASSIHQSASNQVSSSANVGPYPTVAANACTSCHQEHHSSGPMRLLRAANPSQPGMDAATQSCVTCHNGGTFLSPAAPNIMAEQAKNGHPLPAGNNTHDATEAAALSNNRHATCVDCHSAHGSGQVTTFNAPPAMRISQSGAVGVSALDGTTVLTPAVNQYETCLRCHGIGPGKQRLAIYGYAPIREVAAPDALNVIPEFSANAASSHPVFHDRSSTLQQPSLLTNMVMLNGQTSPRPTGPHIFCTDCHNSDDNREFGGSGANGPHGSKYAHMLERNYQFSQALVPGGPVTNTFPGPDLTQNGPFAMCAKCHDLSTVLSTTSWVGHTNHVSADGFSCSVCHTSHGMGSNSPNVTGERLVNFDVNVVGENNSLAISYNRSTGNCTLTCHQVAHNADGSVTHLATLVPGKKK